MRKLKKIIVAGLVGSIIWLNSRELALQAENGYLGKIHFYSVLMTDSGEADVYARLVIANTGGRVLDEVVFEIPRGEVEHIEIYQLKLFYDCSGVVWLKKEWPKCLEGNDPE